MIQDEVAGNAYKKEDDAEAKEVPALTEVMRAQVDLLIENKVRIDKAGQKVESNNLREQDSIRTKIPLMPVAQAKHRPPNLGADEKEESSP